MNRLVLIASFFMVTTLACDHRPVQKDIPPPHNSNGSSNMDHGEMNSSPGAADAPYDLQFIDTMIVHHQAAIDAAQLAATRAEHPELKKLAKSIVSDQQQEIAQMRSLRQQWFANHAPAINMDFPGMSEGMAGMDLEKLDPLKENAFDLEFLRQMIPHHQGAVTMAKDLLGKESQAELKTLAQKIVQAQQAEIVEMQGWQKQWNR